MEKLIVLSQEIVFFKSLDERRRRLYAGLKAQELGWHGVELVSCAYNIHANTVRRGKKELMNSSLMEEVWVRKAKQSRKKKG